MCAILDANAVHEVFGRKRPEAGEQFFEWINAGRGRLVAGGKLFKELTAGSEKFRRWSKEAVAAGRMRLENEDRINKRTESLRRTGQYTSDDPHIIAIAQVSNARLLYSNDKDLQQDFKAKTLIDSPRGKIYSTLRRNDFSSVHKQLLATRDLCRVKP